MTYAVTFTASAAKELRAIDPPVRRRILAKVSALADEPRPAGCRALVGQPGYRIRIGDWRVLYTVHDEDLLVLVVRVGPRGSVYRR